MYLDKCINYSVMPIKTDQGKYIYLYETTNRCNGDIYIGVRIYRGVDFNNDTYIGNGCKILKDGRLYKRRGKETTFRRALTKYGYLNFEKKIICFFTNIEDALRSEANIVDEKFLERPDVLNMVIGGGFPPMGEGEVNNNYGRCWSETMKRRLSRKRRKNGKSKGNKNPKAKSAYLYDLWKWNEKHLSYLRELEGIKDVRHRKIRQFRYLISEVRLKNNKEIEEYVMGKCAEKYRKTYKILQLVKQGLSNEEIVNMGFNKAHVARLKRKYNESN